MRERFARERVLRASMSGSELRFGDEVRQPVFSPLLAFGLKSRFRCHIDECFVSVVAR